MAVLTDRNPVVAARTEEGALRDLEELLSRVPGTTRLFLGTPTSRRDIPASVQRLLVAMIRELARGKAVSIASMQRDLTTQQAADLLNVSRPFVVKLLESGAIPFHRVGTHRRIHLEDLLNYRQHRSEDRGAALTELARETQEQGFYQ